MEDVQLAGGYLVRNYPCARAVDHEEVEYEELVVELDALLGALLEQRLQDHVAGAIGRVTRSFYGRLTVIASVSAEPPLVDLPIGRAVEREAHALELEDGMHRLLAHDVDRVLVGEEVRALHRVEGMPLPGVLLDVCKGRAHAPLGRARVGAGRIELRNDGRAHPLRCLEGGPQPGPTGADDDGVVAVEVGHQIQALPRFERALVRPAGLNALKGRSGWAV